MFFDTFAVLVLTFFASLGMVTAGEWLLRNPFRKNIRRKVFAVAKVSSVSEETIEPALRTLFSEAEGMNCTVFLDCDGASEKAVFVCRHLEKRFNCETFFDEDELIYKLGEYLHGKKKTL